MPWRTKPTSNAGMFLILWVTGYVKLRPYRQTSISRTSFNKLSKRYYGPFQTSERIGAEAYRLALPADSRIHYVFHCSILKPHHGSWPHLTNPLPPQATDNHPLIEPLQILNRKWDSGVSPPSLLVLVQWNGLAPEETSWEKWEELRETCHLEDKVVLPAAGVDRARQTRPKRATHKPVFLQEYAQG